MKMVTVKIPEDFNDGLQRLVGDGMYPSRSAAIRVAVRDLLKDVLWMANESRTLMGTPVTFKRWIMITCPECKKVIYVRKDWRSRRCLHCQKRFYIDFDELLIIGTYEKLTDAQNYMSKSNRRNRKRR